MKTDSGYPKDEGVTLITKATPGNPLRYNTHRSTPPVSALAHSRGPRRVGGRPPPLRKGVCVWWRAVACKGAVLVEG